MTSVSKSAVLVLLFLAFAALGHAQETGDSYVRLIVNGQPATTFLSNKKYAGWMEVMNVEATLDDGSKDSAGKTHTRLWAIHTLDDGRTFLFLPKSGRRGPGRLSFLAGEDGDLRPVV